MAKLYENIVDRETTNRESNEKILSAYDKVLQEQYGINEKNKTPNIVDINESMGTDKTKEIREVLKKKLGLSNRDVSVKYSGSIDVKLKTVKSLPYKNKIKEVAGKHESYQRDQATGDILRGGNTFVFVELDWKFRDQLVKKIEAEISKNITDEFMNGEGGGNVIRVYGKYEVVKNRQSKHDEFWVSHPKKAHAGPMYRSIIEAAGGVLSLMLEYEDVKNLKKLG